MERLDHPSAWETYSWFETMAMKRSIKLGAESILKNGVSCRYARMLYAYLNGKCVNYQRVQVFSLFFAVFSIVGDLRKQCNRKH